MSYEDELRLVGVRERALAEGRTAWADGADVDELFLVLDDAVEKRDIPDARTMASNSDQTSEKASMKASFVEYSRDKAPVITVGDKTFTASDLMVRTLATRPPHLLHSCAR